MTNQLFEETKSIVRFGIFLFRLKLIIVFSRFVLCQFRAPCAGLTATHMMLTLAMKRDV